MTGERLHRFEVDGTRYALDPETCFCFECDEASWDVLGHYPEETVNRICHLLGDQHPRTEVEEVIGELEWLRSTKSILQTPRQEDLARRFELETGLRDIAVLEIPAEGVADGVFVETAAMAGRLLLARSERQRALRLDLRMAGAESWRRVLASDAWHGAAGELCRLANQSRKNLSFSTGFDASEQAARSKFLAGHGVEVSFVSAGDGAPPPAEAWRKLAAVKTDRLDKMPGVFDSVSDIFAGRLTVRPGGDNFDGMVAALEKAGFAWVEFDTDAPFIALPGLDPERFTDSLLRNASDYAGLLLKGRLLRVEPFASLFLQIYHGEPKFRRDPAGVNALAVTGSGGVFPGPHFMGIPACHAGSLRGNVDTDLLRRFNDAGALTTPVCLRCWARGLCGGGDTALHQARTGDFRAPDPAWCCARRRGIEGAVAAFNRLSGAGVNFTRLHGNLSRQARPSLWTMARAAVQLRISARPLEEADAPLLVQWENWNDAAYFTFTEGGMLLGARYDREMDALHPSPLAQELLLTRRDGRPMGLVRVKPDLLPGLGWLWLYLRKEEDYAAGAVRSSLRMLLGEALRGRGLRRVITPAGPGEDALAGCLAAAGFTHAGTARGALFLHGKYHDVRLFAYEVAESE